ncbi:MFS transporter [Calidifontibacillus oryziterrae]|uniref:MFS transporter n=1 Tax=Calidifontibacillus oryziterrae TaxID=1191699 RepID=UPI0002D4D646|nr:MFS transporter [Calidifontibacillus oryziterrae]
MEKDKRWDIASLASIPLVMTLGNSMLIPVLPTLEKELNISGFQSSLIITVYSVVAIILIPIAGFLSDRIGRKMIIIPSLLIAAIGGVISGWAAWKLNEPYFLIMVGRILQGIGAAGASPIVLPLVGDIFRDDRDVSTGLGIIETSNTFGKVLSPILGALLAGVIWYMPFWSIPVFCMVSLVMVLFLVKSPPIAGKDKNIKTFYYELKTTFKTNGRWLYSIFTIGGIMMFVLFGVLFYLSSMLEDEHQVMGVKKGIILSIPLAALCFSSYISGKGIKKNKTVMKWVTFFSLLLLAITALGTSFSTDIYVLLTSMFIFGLAIGATLPCLDALITEGMEKEKRGTVTSIYSSMRFVGVALGPPIFSYLMKISHQIMFYVITISIVVALTLTLLAIRPDQEEKNHINKEIYQP